MARGTRCSPGRHRANGAGVAVDELASLLAHKAAAPQVRADALDALLKIQKRAERTRTDRSRVMLICNLSRAELLSS